MLTFYLCLLKIHIDFIQLSFRNIHFGLALWSGDKRSCFVLKRNKSNCGIRRSQNDFRVMFVIVRVHVLGCGQRCFQAYESCPECWKINERRRGQSGTPDVLALMDTFLFSCLVITVTLPHWNSTRFRDLKIGVSKLMSGLSTAVVRIDI